MFSAAIVMVQCRAAVAQELDVRLKRISEDWKRRREAIKTVRYRAEAAKTKHLLLLDFVNNRHRLAAENYEYNLTTGKSTKVTFTRAFDGTSLMGVGEREGDDRWRKPFSAADANAAISTGLMTNAPFDDDLWPYFASHGCVCIGPRQRIVPGELKVEPKIDLLRQHGEANQDGRACLVFRTPPRRGNALNFEEYWIDFERDSAVLRRRYFTNATPFDDLEMQYTQTGHGWLVSKWTRTTRVENKGTSISTGSDTALITELKIDEGVSDSDFAIALKPGTLVVKTHRGLQDPTGEKNTALYRVQDDGSLRKVTIINGVEIEASNLSLWWTLLLLPLGGALLYWRFHNRQVGSFGTRNNSQHV
jgi:hypothetical protein